MQIDDSDNQEGSTDQSSDSGSGDRIHALSVGDDRVEACAHGAHVLRWRAGGHERLYLSPRARFAPGVAIRGGVPVVFPQFADRGRGPRHGFARTRTWTLLPGLAADRLTFGLGDDASTRAVWPHAFVARLDVSLSTGALQIALSIENTGATDLEFTAALHTYLAVQDLAAARLLGLTGRRYRDMAGGGRDGRQLEDSRLPAAGLDRIYPAVDASLTLLDGAHRLEIAHDGFNDVVVWNPGHAAAQLDDLGAGEQARFVCVEAATVESPVQLAPGACWRGLQRLKAVDPATVDATTPAGSSARIPS